MEGNRITAVMTISIPISRYVGNVARKKRSSEDKVSLGALNFPNFKLSLKAEWCITFHFLNL